MTWLTTTLGLPAMLLALAGCSSTPQDAFPPPCPSVRILSGAGDLTRSRNNSPDITDTTLQGRIEGVSGSCKLSGRNGEEVDVTIQATLGRGAAGGPAAEVPYFVAVSEGDRILDKRVMAASVRFGGNQDQQRVTLGPTQLLLPVSSTRTAADYTIWVGFQLTPDELARNRAAGSR